MCKGTTDLRQSQNDGNANNEYSPLDIGHLSSTQKNSRLTVLYGRLVLDIF